MILTSFSQDSSVIHNLVKCACVLVAPNWIRERVHSYQNNRRLLYAVGYTFEQIQALENRILAAMKSVAAPAVVNHIPYYTVKITKNGLRITLLDSQ